MKKIETIWHHLLFEALTNKKFKFTQKELAQKFGYSLSTIHYSLKKPEALGAIRKSGKFFVLEDVIKLLYFWGSFRNLNRDILYQAFVNLPVLRIESLVPAKAIYACYSAARKILMEPPADYAKVYFYLPQENLEDLKQRYNSLQKKNQGPNLFVLKMPATLPQYGNVATLPQTFVDIWSLKDWYAKDFTKALEEKINGILS